MRTQEKLLTAADAVGQFIEYWGFRSIHGRIWTVVFLSPEPISTLDIIKRLEVSKGLISKAIGELIDFGLIEHSGQTTYARRTYIACEDVGVIVSRVLKQREMVLLKNNEKTLSSLSLCSREDLSEAGVDPKKLQMLLQLTEENSGFLQALLTKKFLTLTQWIKLTRRARSFLMLLNRNKQA